MGIKIDQWQELIFSQSRVLFQHPKTGSRPIGVAISDHVTIFSYAAVFKLSHVGMYFTLGRDWVVQSKLPFWSNFEARLKKKC